LKTVIPPSQLVQSSESFINHLHDHGFFHAANLRLTTELAFLVEFLYQEPLQPLKTLGLGHVQTIFVHERCHRYCDQWIGQLCSDLLLAEVILSNHLIDFVTVLEKLANNDF